MRSLARAAGSALIFIVIFLVFLEIGCFIAVKAGWFRVQLPSYSLASSEWFWKASNPNFGVWHQPNGEMHHQRNCFDVYYNSNSFGMRDADVPLTGKPHRAVVLGDSYVEGVGVDYGKRFTEILEQKKHVELLNFGTSGGFGSTQSYVLYKTLASKFSHDAVIFLILPDNDFIDDTASERDLGPKGQWRPFLIGNYPNYQIRYPARDYEPKHIGRNDEVLEDFWLTYRVVKYFNEYFKALARRNSMKRDGQQGPRFSGYYDYSRDQFLRLRYAIEQAKAIAGQRPMLVATIPRPSDFERAEEEDAVPPIRKDLAALSEDVGFTYIDLMPAMADGEEIATYFHDCDGHWSEKGHAKAAEILSAWDYFSAANQL